MDNLLPHESELIGTWVEQDGRVVADATCNRIDDLTNDVLDFVQDHPREEGWVRLYRDGMDGRFWERSYPTSELHGGGPPTLRWVTAERVGRDYDLRPDHL